LNNTHFSVYLYRHIQDNNNATEVTVVKSTMEKAQDKQ